MKLILYEISNFVQMNSHFLHNPLIHSVLFGVETNTKLFHLAAVRQNREHSSISTIRSWLYKKVFNTKWKSSDWDNFVISL